MRRSHRIVFLSVAVAVLMVLVLFLLRAERNILGFSVLTKGQAAKRMDECSPLDMTECGLSFQDERLPYDSGSNTFYLYQPDVEAWEGRLVLDNYAYTAFWVSDQTEAVVPKGQQKLLICHGDQAAMCTVEICNLPVLSITLTDEEGNLIDPKAIDDEKRVCQYRLFSMDDEEGRVKVQKGYGTLSLRGASSKGGLKPSMKLILTNENYQSVHKNFLGLRKDDDWILNSIFSDTDKIRERVAYQLWDQINGADSSYRAKSADCAYLELCVNQNYRGIYLLQTRVDAKQVGLNQKTDSLFKSDGHLLPGPTEQESYVKVIWSPKDTQDIWSPMERYQNVFFCEDQLRGLTWEDAAAAANTANLMDFFLFKQALYTVDNGVKNTFFLADGAKGDQICKLPWDLNYVFGDDYQVDGRERTVYQEDWPKLWLNEPEIDVLFRLDQQKAAQLLQERWQLLGGTVLSVDHVRTLMMNALSELWDSGALRRNSARWNGLEPDFTYEEWALRVEKLINAYGQKWDQINDYVEQMQLS